MLGPSSGTSAERDDGRVESRDFRAWTDDLRGRPAVDVRVPGIVALGLILSVFIKSSLTTVVC